MSRKKKPSQSNPDSRFSREVRSEVRRSQAPLLISEFSSITTTAIKFGFPCAAIALASYFLGGRETSVKVEGIFRFFANQWIYLSITALFGCGWVIERKALRRRIKEMSDEKKQLEAIIDPGRTSSGMNANGEPVRA